MSDTPSHPIEVNPPSAGATGFPAGWILQHDVRTSRKSREAVWRGPASSADAAFAAALALHPAARVSASRSPGSAVAEIRADRAAGGPGTGQGGAQTYDDLKISDDTWELTPISSPTSLEAHPHFAAVGAVLNSARDALSRGDRSMAAWLVTNAAAPAAGWYGLYMAGVQTFDCVAWTYRYINHISAAAAPATVRAEIAPQLQAVHSVVAWSALKGVSGAPFAEPKWMNGQTATGYEWRCDGVSLAYSGDELTVSYNYTGLWRWAKALYPGGTWEPTA